MYKQEIYCHSCGRYVQFDVPEESGNLAVDCPNCGHTHYRVVEDGIITEERWRSSVRAVPIQTVWASNVASTTDSTDTTTVYGGTSASSGTFSGALWGVGNTTTA